VGYLIVFVVAAAVGVAVYAITLREGLQPAPAAPPGGGTGAGASETAAPPSDGTYVSVSGGTPDWQSRLTGLLGLVVAVVVGAVAMATIAYMAVSAIVRLVGGLAPDAAPS
jgi:hypothetical protein